ncbi:hypothetical protein P8452_38688 [Trifolium repens]|nr:hypothetical protein P8452_38688 [Trifolium repens]
MNTDLIHARNIDENRTVRSRTSCCRKSAIGTLPCRSNQWAEGARELSDLFNFLLRHIIGQQERHLLNKTLLMALLGDFCLPSHRLKIKNNSET